MEIFLIYLWIYLDEVLEKVNMDIVMSKWQKEIVVLDILYDLVKLFYKLMIFFEWREKYFF